jgi:heptosyltransferase-2
MDGFKNILVIRTDRMGDVVLTTPVLKALRVNFPGARISVMLQPAMKDLVDGNPFVDQVLVDDRRKRHKGARGFFRLVRDLRRQKFDTAFIFHTKRRTNLLAFLAGIPLRTGYRDRKWGVLLTRPFTDERPLGLKHEARYCMDIVERLGLETVQLRPFVPLDGRWEVWADRLWAANYSASSGKRVVAVHLGASDPSKCWPVDSYARVLAALRRQSACFEFILIGSAGVREPAAALKTRLDFSLLDLTGQTTVAQLASVLHRCRLLISNDSGPVHLADALGTPVISIFTRNQPGINPERWRPLGPLSCCLAPPPGRDRSYAKAGQPAGHSPEMVDVQQVLDAVDAIFKVC